MINVKQDGKFVIVKGKIDNISLTLANIYVPPYSDRNFFKLLFDTIISESDGILVCAGDWNTVLNHSLDATSVRRQKSLRSRNPNTFGGIYMNKKKTLHTTQ